MRTGRAEIIARLIGAGFGDCELCDPEWEDTPYHVIVPRERFAGATEILQDLFRDCDCHVTPKQKTPALVPAKVGDFVRIYSEFHHTDDDSSVGVVVSSRTLNGRTAYGCGYLELQRDACLAQFVLTGEQHGGWHSGFLAVLTRGQVEEALGRLVRRTAREAVQKALEQRKWALDGIRETLDKLQTGQAYSATIWQPPPERSLSRLSVNVSRLHFKD